MKVTKICFILMALLMVSCQQSDPTSSIVSNDEEKITTLKRGHSNYFSVRLITFSFTELPEHVSFPFYYNPEEIRFRVLEDNVWFGSAHLYDDSPGLTPLFDEFQVQTNYSFINHPSNYAFLGDADAGGGGTITNFEVVMDVWFDSHLWGILGWAHTTPINIYNPGLQSINIRKSSNNANIGTLVIQFVLTGGSGM